MRVRTNAEVGISTLPAQRHSNRHEKRARDAYATPSGREAGQGQTAPATPLIVQCVRRHPDGGPVKMTSVQTSVRGLAAALKQPRRGRT